MRNLRPIDVKSIHMDRPCDPSQPRKAYRRYLGNTRRFYHRVPAANPHRRPEVCRYGLFLPWYTLGPSTFSLHVRLYVGVPKHGPKPHAVPVNLVFLSVDVPSGGKHALWTNTDF